MPQMAPMSWMLLFSLFVMIFMMFNTMNYFSFFYQKSLYTITSPKKKLINWKW
uniref:ATP synthase complex subunit 8 n=1 Tax=Espanoliella jeanneli TaxID=723344 RepID=A0A0S2M760_9COLE|nr:ATP synthase F0 subunit 8 [Espanoliella jeanneli]